MAYLVAAVVLIGVLGAVNLLLTIGILRQSARIPRGLYQPADLS